MTRRAVLIPPLVQAGGAAAAATIRATLVDADQRPLLGYTDAEGIIEAVTVEADPDGTTLTLTPQSDIYGESWWQITLASQGFRTTYTAQVPAGEIPIPLADLIILPDPVDPADPISERLLPVPDSLEDGLVLATRDGVWILTDTPSGDGIPDAPLTDGPYGRQGGAWVDVAPPVTLVAATTLSGHRAIAADADGKAIYADQSDATALAAVGISTQAAVADDVLILAVQGALDWPAAGLTAGATLYLGASGVLTHSAPTTGWVRQIAQAVDTDRIVISLGPAYWVG